MHADFLMHFCARKHTTNPEAASDVLSAILGSGELRPSECPIWYTPKEKDLNAFAATDCDGSLPRPALTPAETAKIVLQRRFRMVCFTDIRLNDIPNHVAQFGSFGLALLKSSPAAQKCWPVHYVTPESPAVFYSDMIARLRALAPKLSKRRPESFETVLDKLEEYRWQVFQDIVNRDQHEWRWTPNDANPTLPFEPEDVPFIFVDTWKTARRWTERLHDPGNPALFGYGKAGTLVIPVEFLHQSGVR